MKKSEENKFLEIYLGIMENENKNRYIYFFIIFQWLEMKKKNIYNEKRKKKNCAEIWNLLLPKLYCNTTDCIARVCGWLGRKCIARGVRL